MTVHPSQDDAHTHTLTWISSHFYSVIKKNKKRKVAGEGTGLQKQGEDGGRGARTPL